MKLTIVESGEDTDWYTIERAEHDGRTWLEERDYGAALMYSGRIGDADVEGPPLGEMVAIATGIRDRKEVSFKRCAVEIDGDRVWFWSPRNTTVRGDSCSLAEADELAAAIFKLAASEGDHGQ